MLQQSEILNLYKSCGTGYILGLYKNSGHSPAFAFLFNETRSYVTEAEAPRKLQNVELDDLYSLLNIMWLITLRNIRWVGHVVCMGEKKNAYKFCVIFTAYLLTPIFLQSKIKIKSSLFSLTTSWNMEVQLHIFLSLSASRCSMGPRANQYVVWNRQISCPCLESNTNFLAVQPLTQSLWAY
jgi:hypothetical protein